jgi:DNA-binding NarL/FixJ family response regulator
VAINLAVIEDDPMLCEEIIEYFSKKEHIHCVLVVDSIARFKHFFREFMNINVVLLDINLPTMSGVDGLPVIRRLLPDAEIVMHTMVNDHDTVFKCICAGANGYLLKDGNLQNLERTLIEIEENSGCALTPSVARRILAYFQPASRQNHPEQLSDQELKVSRLLVDGMPYQQVADVLNLSINGVRYHIKNIYRKLHITSKGELLKRYREGRIDL